MFGTKSVCCCFLALLQSHAAAFLVDPVSDNHVSSIKDNLEDAIHSVPDDVTGKASTQWNAAAIQDQIRLAITGDLKYPEALTYTEQHIWFAPDVNVSKSECIDLLVIVWLTFCDSSHRHDNLPHISPSRQ